MKQIIGILALSIFTVSAHAALPDVPHAALCGLYADPDALVKPDLEETHVIDVRNVTSVSPVVLNYINQHLQREEYTTADLDLAGIQAFFAKEEPYNEIYVVSYKVKSSGVTFTEVRSYPGDNLYSIIFDAVGNVVADVHDGDVYLKIGTESLACWSVAE
ncbi:hypothetical protein D3C87_1150560 [compost metagenome]